METDSLENFIDKVDKQLSYRKKYLSNLNDIILNLDNHNQKMSVIRATLPELCANYEGFFRFLFKELIQYIQKINPSNDVINKNFLILYIVTALDGNYNKQDKKANKLYEIFNNVFAEQKEYLSQFNPDKYNIKPDYIPTTLNILNINMEQMPMDKLTILYSRRNSIAHGELNAQKIEVFRIDQNITSSQLAVAYEFWLGHLGDVIKILDQLKESIINYIINEEFKESKHA